MACHVQLPGSSSIAEVPISLSRPPWPRPNPCHTCCLPLEYGVGVFAQASFSRAMCGGHHGVVVSSTCLKSRSSADGSSEFRVVHDSFVSSRKPSTDRYNLVVPESLVRKKVLLASSIYCHQTSGVETNLDYFVQPIGRGKLTG